MIHDISLKDEYRVGDIVSYEYVAEEEGNVWRWGVAEVKAKPMPRLVEVALWQPKERVLGAAEQKRVDALLLELNQKTAEAEKRRASAEETSRLLEVEAAKISQQQAEAESRLAQIQPALDEARKGLAAIDGQTLQEVRSYPTPPPTVKKVLESVLLVLQVSNSAQWDVIKNFVRRDDFIQTVRDFDAGEMRDETRAAVEEVFRDGQITIETARRASKAAGPLFNWVLTQLKISAVLKEVKPQKQRLEMLSTELRGKKLNLEQGRQDIAKLEGEIIAMKRRYDELVFGAVEKQLSSKNANPLISFATWVPSKTRGKNVVILHAQILGCLDTDVIDLQELTLEPLLIIDLNARADSVLPPVKKNPLEDKLREVTAQLDAAQDELMDRAVKLSISEKEVARLQMELDLLKAETSTLATRCASAEAAMKDEQIKAFQLTEELEESRAQTSITAREVVQHKGGLSELQREIENLQSQIASLEDRRREDALLLEETREELVSSRAEADQLLSEMGNRHAVNCAKETQTEPVAAEAAVAAPPPPQHVDPVEQPAAEEPPTETPPPASPSPEEDDFLEQCVIRGGSLIPNPAFLCAAFEVTKIVQATLFRRLKRVWVIDFFAKKFHNLDSSGKISKSYSSAHLVMLEKHPSDPLLLNLLFFGRDVNHELSFATPYMRERFYEFAQALRPTVTVYAPNFIDTFAPLSENDNVKVTITTKGAQPIVAQGVTPAKQQVTRQLTGDCSLRLSRVPDEEISIWIGTWNLGKRGAISDSEQLGQWMPRNAHDMYVVACTNADPTAVDGPPGTVPLASTMRGASAAWVDIICAHLGHSFQIVATISLGAPLTLIVLCRTRHLTKMCAIEGSKVQVSPDTGGCGIRCSFYDTTYAFLAVNLPRGREESTSTRSSTVNVILEKLQFCGDGTDLLGMTNNVFVFGDCGCFLDPAAPLSELAGAQNYDELLEYDAFYQERKSNGLLEIFKEPPIKFGPTAFTEDGPAYYSRVLFMSNEASQRQPVCQSYSSVESLATSEYFPVQATFVAQCLRPAVSCFASSLGPVPFFVFEYISFEITGESEVVKPVLALHCPYGAHGQLQCKPTTGKPKSMTPKWIKEEIPLMEMLSDMHEYVERVTVTFVLKDLTMAKEAARVGVATMPLLGCIKTREGQPQRVDLPVQRRGKNVGRCSVEFTWHTSQNGKKYAHEGIFLSPS